MLWITGLDPVKIATLITGSTPLRTVRTLTVLLVSPCPVISGRAEWHARSFLSNRRNLLLLLFASFFNLAYKLRGFFI